MEKALESIMEKRKYVLARLKAYVYTCENLRVTVCVFSCVLFTFCSVCTNV